MNYLRSVFVGPFMWRLTIEPRALVVIAGLPGSGKSTLLRCTETDTAVTVLDSDQLRDRLRALLPRTPYSRYRPLVHVLHRLRVTWHVLRDASPVVVHDPATGAATRAWLRLLGQLAGRARHFVWVECPPEQAAAGQRTRGRVLRRGSFQRHVRRLPRVRAALRAGPRGWHTTTIVDRVAVADGLHLRVRPRPSAGPR
ncbi:ABC-type polar amino acid transport system, ATPase component [Saccharomonospora marina XMU15]|uniref:ABC-type polar amino acid transport system, ATPase component n=2 Tax=Saccharomonospora TaxID=1851 RepID=H5X4N0_9PSEU|nr:ABC-type polar amino acid transport system, ATPase component [Saccharomonospora marina XMU15]